MGNGNKVAGMGKPQRMLDFSVQQENYATHSSDPNERPSGEATARRTIRQSQAVIELMVAASALMET